MIREFAMYQFFNRKAAVTPANGWYQILYWFCTPTIISKIKLAIF